MVDNVFKTQFELYLTNSGNNDKFHYNFYTDKWGGVYRRNIHVVEHENYISNATPNGRLMEQSPESASGAIQPGLERSERATDEKKGL